MPSVKATTAQTRNNQRSNALNPNYGTTGNNTTNAHHHGNRGAQLNPNRIQPAPGATPTPQAPGKPRHG